jgi:radical SAM protein with 4Fe4S-binding SPASM domain
LLSTAEEYGFRVCITTNGTLLSSEGHVLLSHSDVLHKVSVSLHSLEGNGTVSGQEADRYLSDAIAFAKEASARGTHTVLRLWNLDADGREGRNLANSAIEARLHDAFPEEWKPRWNGFRLKQSVFLEYAGIFTWPTESDAEAVEDGYCHGLLDQLAVLADGTVTPCCLDSEGEIALGNLYQSTLSEILSAPRATAMREGFAERKMVEPLCKKCTYARRFRR